MSMRYLEKLVTLELDAEKCTGCGRCTQVCPHAVFELVDGVATLRDRGACMECGACQRNCAFGAITVDSGVGCAAALLDAMFRRKQDATCGPTGGCC